MPGIPKPGGSKTTTVIRNRAGEIVMKNGRPLTTTRDDAKGNREWKQQVAVFAQQAYRAAPLNVPLAVSMRFQVLRPKGHFGARGNVLPSKPAYPDVKPDVLKLARSTEDACTGIIWTDDAKTVALSLTKVYADTPGVEITITLL